MIHYIVARSLQHADTTATVDWGWKRDRVANRRGYRNLDGDFVLPVADTNYLRGVRPPSKIYLGFEAWRVRDLEDFIFHFQAAGGITVSAA